MNDQYLLIQMEHLKKAWLRGKEVLEQALPARLEDDCFCLQAFGEACKICPDIIKLGGKPATRPKGILISLYARSVRNEPARSIHSNLSKSYLAVDPIKVLLSRVLSKLWSPMCFQFRGKSRSLLSTSRGQSTLTRPLVISLSLYIHCLVFPFTISFIFQTKNSPRQ